MKRIIITALIIFTCATLPAQVNYVRNPSFEEYSQCPNTVDQIHFANFWSAIDSNGNGSSCDPEFCHSCSVNSVSTVPDHAAFYQSPRTGNGLANLQVFYDESIMPAPINLYRDYLQGRLHQSLNANVSYCITFYISLADKSHYSVNRVGAYLDDGSIDTAINACGLPQSQYTPQVAYNGMLIDTMNWTKVEGTITANGTEKFITIGNFYDLANTAYIDIKPNCFDVCNYSWIVVDDVSVIESNLDAFAGNDTTIYQGDSVFVGRTPEIGLQCKWYVNGNLIDSIAGFWVYPATTTTYVVEQVLCGLVKTDTVTVTVLPVGIGDVRKNSSICIYPNPANRQLTIRIDKAVFHSYIIANSIGQQLMTEALKEMEVQIDISKLPAGVYYLSIEGEGGREVSKFVKL